MHHLVTALDNPAHLACASGAADWLAKPFALEDVLAKVGRLCADG